MNRFAVAWVAALALATATAAAAQMSPPPNMRPPHPPHPIHSMHPGPIAHRSPRPTRTGQNGLPYQPYVMVPPSYVENALYPPNPARTAKPRPTPTPMYEIFSTIKNR